MRITFIAPACMSGGARVVSIYAKALMEMGHSVSIVTGAEPVPIVTRIASWLGGSGWPGPSVLPRSHFDDTGVELHVLERWRPAGNDDVPDADAVIATWWPTAEWVAALDEKKGAKIYFIQHHEIHEQSQSRRAEATYRLPLHKIVVADWLRHVMSSRYRDRIVDVVPNSVDKEQFFAPFRGKQPVPTVGFLYATTPFKGVDVTLAAIQIVRRRFTNLRVISFGTQEPTKDVPLPGGTEFVHLPPQSDIRKLYASCDVWISASRTEGFNLPAMEAMACRTPVVSTRTGWPEEAIKSKSNGLLVDVDDVMNLARGIEWILSRRDDEWRTLSTNAFATVEASSWQQSATLFELALKHACERARRGEIGGACGSGGAEINTKQSVELS